MDAGAGNGDQRRFGLERFKLSLDTIREGDVVGVLPRHEGGGDMRQAVVKRFDNTAIGLRDHDDARVPAAQVSEDFSGCVLRAVIDNQDAQPAHGLLQERFNRLHDGRRAVVDGQQDIDERT
jgi:hypothetical protein